ncbi:tRNA lysidine(34) synthetase TilS [Roseomonas populi]|uniref:tRNA(Ile)-lysidine synthase n=1 Tax=Roseomonas populi TaxID=3121582 RepID=A0ABT1X291_9PROT|nr:tRNA lysidine(34) synthetase TilS [Roseomonas pecuniae]MCR0982220.1 tRNA lysidine(34) synthetase TilS [Roseomonas pecuniae]
MAPPGNLETVFAAGMAGLGPFGPSPLLAVGVSGGPHSLALAILASGWALARGGRVLALVADHGLRAESTTEAAGVAARLGSLGIPAAVLTLGLAPGPGLHERARAARLSALAKAAEAAGAPWLLLGQHLADQAETLAFRALRGSGPVGLAGMAAARPAGAVMILRPLLDATPAAIETFLSERGLVPVRDPSNDDPRFARARLRRALGDPGGTGPGVAALAEAARAFGERRDRLRAAVAARLAGCTTFRTEGWAVLDAAALGRDAVAEAALSALLRALGGGAHPPARAAVAAMLARGGGSLGGALWRGRFIGREPARCAAAVPAEAGVVWDGRWRVCSVPDGGWIGAAGPGFAGIGLAGFARGGLPGFVAAGLPVLRDASGRVMAGPGPGPGWRVEFRPESGPIA